MSAFTVFRDPEIARPSTAGGSKTPLHRSKGLGSHKDTGNTLKAGTPAGKTVAATPRRALGDVSNNNHVLKNAKTPGFASARKPSKLAIRSESTAKTASKPLGLKQQSTNRPAGLSNQQRQPHMKERQQLLQAHPKNNTRQQQHKRPWWDRPVERMPMNDDDMELSADPFKDTLARAFGDADQGDDGDLDLDLDSFAPEPIPFPPSSTKTLDVFNDLQDSDQASLVGVPRSLDDDGDDLDL